MPLERVINILLFMHYENDNINIIFISGNVKIMLCCRFFIFLNLRNFFEFVCNSLNFLSKVHNKKINQNICRNEIYLSFSKLKKYIRKREKNKKKFDYQYLIYHKSLIF